MKNVTLVIALIFGMFMVAGQASATKFGNSGVFYTTNTQAGAFNSGPGHTEIANFSFNEASANSPTGQSAVAGSNSQFASGYGGSSNLFTSVNQGASATQNGHSASASSASQTDTSASSNHGVVLTSSSTSTGAFAKSYQKFMQHH